MRGPVGLPPTLPELEILTLYRCHEGAMSNDSLAGIPMDMASVLDGVDRLRLQYRF